MLVDIGAVRVWVHPSTFYDGPCFQCGARFSGWYPLKIQGNSEMIHFCGYPCLKEYRESLARK